MLETFAVRQPDPAQGPPPLKLNGVNIKVWTKHEPTEEEAAAKAEGDASAMGHEERKSANDGQAGQCDSVMGRAAWHKKSV
jgi:hypothetical protein